MGIYSYLGISLILGFWYKKALAKYHEMAKTRIQTPECDSQ
jgi:hypothetical protein